MTIPILALDQVTKVYPGETPVHALRGADLTVHAGELLAVVGPSGSGKSTMLHVMGTLDLPSSGVVRVTGVDVATLSDRQLAALRATRIGFVFQQFFLSEHATLLDNVADGLLYAGVPARERRRLAMDALARVGLNSRAGSRPNTLSGGQRQRVAIARALAKQPRVILADEPTASLDQETGKAILELLLKLQASSNVTVIVSSHDPMVHAHIPTRIALRDGAIAS